MKQKGYNPERVEPSQTWWSESKGLAPLVIIILIALGLGGYLLYQKQFKSTSASKPSPAPTVSDKNVSWKAYVIKEIGIEFQLPKELADKSDFKQDVIRDQSINTAQKGDTICIRFSKKKISLVRTAYAGGVGCFKQDDDLLLISSISKDFTAPRSGTFGELQGFKVENNKYYFRDNYGRFFDAGSIQAEVIDNPNKVSILKVIGDSPSVSGYEMGYPIAGSLGKGDIGALINTNNPNYPGIALQTKLADIDKDTFNQILPTFKFLP